FLLIGVLFYQTENHHLKRRTFYLLVTLIFLLSLMRSQSLQPKLNDSNFELFALVAFYGLWRYRSCLTGNAIVKTLSEMTYAVYLFHLWSWPYLGTFVEKYGFASLPNRLQRLVLLLLFCLLAAKTIEKYGIRWG